MTYPKTWTAQELTTADVKKVVWVIENFISAGLAILAGNKKIGKSFLTLDLAIAIGTGAKALGEFSTNQGQVLVLALEDNVERLQRRLNMRGGCRSQDIEFITMHEGWLPLEAGGLRMIKEWIDAHPQARAVIIDTLQTVAPVGAGYSTDCKQLRQLSMLAAANGVAIIAVHHVRKSKTDDPFDGLLGSQGIGATADTLLVLKRARNTGQAKLSVTGRDVGEREMVLQLNIPPGTWTYIGDRESVCKTDERQQVWNVIAAGDQTVGISNAEIQTRLSACGIDRKPNAIRFLLHRMVKDDELKRVKKGRYATNRQPDPLDQLALLATTGGDGSPANDANKQTKRISK